MIIGLRIFFAFVLGAMLWVTSWASLDTALWDIPWQVAGHPWFVASLFDAYFGFLTFYVWLAYKEPTWAARTLWLALILALGNIAMASYMLLQLFRLPPDASMEQLILRRGAAA